MSLILLLSADRSIKIFYMRALGKREKEILTYIVTVKEPKAFNSRSCHNSHTLLLRCSLPFAASLAQLARLLLSHV